jgi:plasmid stabilization system protein ParE
VAGERFEIHWSVEAFRDLEDLLEHIERDRPAAAAGVRDRIFGSVESLQRFPRRGRAIREFLPLGKKDVREIVVAPWRIFFEVRNQAVEILAVVDGRRNVEDLILRRLTRGTRRKNPE